MRRYLLWIGGGLAALLALLIVASFFIDEPLRRHMERQLNASVKGYRFSVGKLDFHPFGFSIDLEKVKVVQESAPEPPVATLDKWHASLEWKALLFGRLVNDHRIERPVLHLTRTQAKKEAEDEVPVEDKGWQDAVEAVYPFKVDRFEIVDGDVTYVDESQPSKPLRFSHIQLLATNIRNVRSPDRVYPSELHFDGDLFEQGHLRMTGHANFLARPHLGIQAEFHLGTTPLEPLLPVSGRFNVQIHKGTVAADGKIEYAPQTKLAELKQLTLDGVHMDYVHSAQTAAEESERGKQAYDAGAKAATSTELQLHAEQVQLRNCEFGFVNKAAEPPYRVFMTDTDLKLEHFSNQFSDGTGTLNLTGKFMGSGDTKVNGTFRREDASPDFNVAVEIRQVQMKALNNLWRAYAKFDVATGFFSLFSELTIKDGKVQGYLKPLFKDVQVYEERQDRNKGFLQKVYEGLVGDLTGLLRNQPRKEVATKTEISGDLKNPKTDTWDAVVRLVQNAFFDAILPGLEHQIGRR
jgi:hypothetical protein